MRAIETYLAKSLEGKVRRPRGIQAGTWELYIAI